MTKFTCLVKHEGRGYSLFKSGYDFPINGGVIFVSNVNFVDRVISNVKVAKVKEFIYCVGPNF